MNKILKKIIFLFLLMSSLSLAQASDLLVYGIEDEIDTGIEAIVLRDPFWPVGYNPDSKQVFEQVAEPDSENENKIDESAPVVEVAEIPVDEEEWETAEKTIPRQSGIFSARNPESGKSELKMLLDKKNYFAGDLLYVTNNAIEFVWKIDSIEFSPPSFKTSRVRAERVPKTR
jgi:hypothetical protein